MKPFLLLSTIWLSLFCTAQNDNLTGYSESDLKYKYRQCTTIHDSRDFLVFSCHNNITGFGLDEKGFSLMSFNDYDSNEAQKVIIDLKNKGFMTREGRDQKALIAKSDKTYKADILTDGQVIYTIIYCSYDETDKSRVTIVASPFEQFR